jgi:hypothetical protein
MPCKTNSTSVCRAIIELVSINCRGHHGAKFSSLLLFLLSSHGNEKLTVEAKVSVRMEYTNVKFSKWIENCETKNK